MNDLNNVRNYNEGNSDYAKHKFQSWDFWIKYKINNGFDCDIIKRILRTKSTDPRILDYKKIKHICLERIRQFQNNENVFPVESFELAISLDEMIEDYDLTSDDVLVLTRVLYPCIENRVSDYECIIKTCDKIIQKIEK